MAAGVPVVSSRAAARGIAGRAGEHLLVADEAAEWARAIADLVERPDHAEELVANARRLVRDRYSWDRKAAEYESVLEAAAAVHRAPLAEAVR
jgi:glycosyltransferase involved in cell wall biosynthesis